MNILFTYPYPFNPNHGGVERVTDILCHEFLELGHKVVYLNCHQTEKDSYKYPVNVYYLPDKELNSKSNINFYHHTINKENIDIIINQEGMYEYCQFFCNTGNANVKVYSVIHTNPLLDYNFLWQSISELNDQSYKEYIKRIGRCLLYFRIRNQKWKSLTQHYKSYLNNSSEIVLLSDYYRESLYKLAPYLKSRISAIQNPTSFPEVNEIPHKRNEILYVGRLYNRTKQIAKLLKIWSHIYPAVSGWHLSIVGDGPDKTMLIDEANKLKLKDVTFYGFTNPIPFYEKASIICMTSSFEGFPMVLVEAMQFGCVPIAFESFEAVKDIIKTNENGILVTPFQEKEYIQKLKGLMSNTELRKDMSKAAFASVKKFDSKLIAQQWIKLFERKL